MSDSDGQYGIQDILAVLPHRYPFLLVDKIVEYELGVRVVGVKNVTVNEPFFQGHFPAVPIMPGVLIIEAMAQVGGFMVFKTLADKDSKLVFLMGIDRVRFRSPVRPGDQLHIEMIVKRIKSRVGKLEGRASVDGQLVASAEIMFSLVDKEDYGS